MEVASRRLAVEPHICPIVQAKREYSPPIEVQTVLENKKLKKVKFIG